MRDPAARARVARLLDEREFLDARHRVLLRVLLRMEERKLAWSEDTAELLAGGGNYGGVEYVRRVLSEYEALAPANLDAHVERFRTDALKHSMVSECIPRLVEAIEDPKATREDLWVPLRRAQRLLEGGARSGRRAGALVEGFYGAMAERRALPEWVPTYFPELDEKLIWGLAPGHLTLVVARPGVGKTSWVCELIRRRRLEMARGVQGLGTRVFALDMKGNDYLDTIAAAETGISQWRLIREAQSLTREERYRIRDAIEPYRDPRILDVVENPFMDRRDAQLPPWQRNERNLDRFESYLAEDGYPLVVLDVVNQMLADRRPEAVRDSVHVLVEMARLYHKHLLVLHHTGRQQDGRPTLEDIRSSGGWEEFTKVIIALDRPNIRRNRPGKDVLDVGCLKQTKGPAPWWVRYDFDGSRAAFTNGRSLAAGGESGRSNASDDDAF